MNSTLHDVNWEIDQVNLAINYYQEAISNSKAWENDPEVTEEYERPLRQLKIHLRKLIRIRDS